MSSVINRFYEISPAKFRLGDIVEVEFMVTAVRIGKDRFRMLVKLKGLTLIDDSCSKVRLYSSRSPDVQLIVGMLQLASLSRIQLQMSAAKASACKRSNSEMEHSDSEALRRVSRMRIDN